MNGHRTQTDRILAHMQRGHSVSPMLALRRWGCFRLAARIHSLRQAGLSIRSTIERRGGKHYSRYYYP